MQPSLQNALPVTQDMDNLSSKFKCYMVFRFRVNGGYGTDKRTDRRHITCNAALVSGEGSIIICVFKKTSHFGVPKVPPHRPALLLHWLRLYFWLCYNWILCVYMCVYLFELSVTLNDVQGHFSYNNDIYTVSQKNAPTLASCSFDKHGLVLIILGKQHQHTFKNDMYAQLSLSLYFYLLYLLLNSCDGNDAFWRSFMLVKQSSSFSRKHRTLSLQICVRQTVRLTTDFVDWCKNVW